LTDVITNLPSTILNGMSDTLKLLFIPKDNFFSNEFNQLNEQLSNKLSIQSYIDFLHAIGSAEGSRMQNVTVNYYGTTATIINFDIFYKWKDNTDRYIRGFIFALMILFNLNMIYKLIRGDNIISGGGHGMLSVSSTQIGSSEQKLLK